MHGVSKMDSVLVEGVRWGKRWTRQTQRASTTDPLIIADRSPTPKRVLTEQEYKRAVNIIRIACAPYQERALQLEADGRLGKGLYTAKDYEAVSNVDVSLMQSKGTAALALADGLQVRARRESTTSLPLPEAGAPAEPSEIGHRPTRVFSILSQAHDAIRDGVVSAGDGGRERETGRESAREKRMGGREREREGRELRWSQRHCDSQNLEM